MLYPWSQQGYSTLLLAISPVLLTRGAKFNGTLWSTHALQLDSAFWAEDSYRLERSAKYLMTSQGLQLKWCSLQYYTFLVVVTKQSNFWRVLAVIALPKPLLITLQESFSSASNAVHLVSQPEVSEFCFLKERWNLALLPWLIKRSSRTKQVLWVSYKPISLLCCWLNDVIA